MTLAGPRDRGGTSALEIRVTGPNERSESQSTTQRQTHAFHPWGKCNAGRPRFPPGRLWAKRALFLGKMHVDLKPERASFVQPCKRVSSLWEVEVMSSFIPAQVPTAVARRTVRVQAVRATGSATSALFGAGLTVAAIVASVITFATI